MKKLVLRICSIIAALSLSAAHVGAGLASALGWHQPKIPAKIAK